MANHKSALKRARQNEVRRIRNKSYKTRAKTAVKEVKSASETNSPKQAEESFIKAVSIIQKTVSKGVIHNKQASRKISRLALQVNQLKKS